MWWFDIGTTPGAEINGNPWRAFIVVSTDVVNDYCMTVVGVPLTTGGSGVPPLNIPIASSDRPSFAVVDQVRALDKNRLVKPMCALSAAEMEAVEEALREVLEL